MTIQNTPKQSCVALAHYSNTQVLHHAESVLNWLKSGMLLLCLALPEHQKMLWDTL
jgi:hypothetical protein